jgi:hypothetical protein
MVAKGFGSKDSDKVGKEKTDKPMLKASARTPYTGKIGGPANTPARNFKRGGSIKRGR